MGRSSAAKFSRLKAFAKAYPSLIRKIRRDKDNSEEAEVLYLIAKTGFRIGSESETLAETKAFGASTLRCSHVNVNSNTLSFEFTGKKGVQIRKVVRDNFLAGNIAGRCGGNTDQKIFKTSDDEIRKYLNSLPKGPGFLVKDFRTYLATLTALRKIQSMPAPRNKSEFKRYRKEVGSAVASELGNSPTIALKSYVPPEVFGPWECGHAAPEDKSRGKGFSYGDSFLECVQYDEEVPVEECRDCDPLERKE
jgi:DNA topoisomerase-1